MQVNLLTKVRFTLRTLKYYFEVFLHLKAKKLWFLNICSKIFRFRNCYERVLFLCAIFVRKCRLKKNESQFFDNCGGPRGYMGLQTIKYSMKPSPFTPYSFSMKVGSPSHSRSSSLSRSRLWTNSEVPCEVERLSAWATIATERTIYLKRVGVLGYFSLDQNFRTFITRPGQMARTYPGKLSGKYENCLIFDLWTTF